MTKKEQDKKQSKEKSQSQPEVKPKLSPEMEKKMLELKDKLDKYKKIVLEKFDKYIVGMSLLPPPQPRPGMLPEETKKIEEEKDKIHILVLVDDTEPTKMSKFELKEKLIQIMDKEALAIDKNLFPQVLLLSELWQNCYDGKYELLKLISISAPIYDTGMLAAITISEVHKSMVLQKFEKYIVAYVLAGSLVQGKATPQSDIDVFIVIDDTDVKKMSRVELKDRLRSIIIGMGIQAGEDTGIKNKINIQTYILTDFWESVKEAHPVIFTFLRDGVPFFDRGIFMPWKQLLKMGRIKPSPEAIDMYMSSGEQMLDRIKFKLRDIGIEDIFWATHTPTNAALMLYGVSPATPKETAQVMRDVFVKKTKLLAEDDVKIIERIIEIRKDVEHGNTKEVTGKLIDELLDNAEKYLKRIKRLFTQIETMKEQETIVSVYDTVVTMMRDILKLEGMEKIVEADLIHEFENKLIATGKVPAKFLRQIHDVMKAKADYDSGKLTKTEVEETRKSSLELVKFLVEYVQRARGKEMQKTKVLVKYGSRYGEVTVLNDTAYIVRDLDVQEKEIESAKINEDGSIGTTTKSSLEEFEKALIDVKIPKRIFVSEKFFGSLQRIFGKDVEMQLSI